MKKLIWAIDPYQSKTHELNLDAKQMSTWFGHCGKIVIQPVFVLTSGVRPMPYSYFKELLPELRREATKRLHNLHANWAGLSLSVPKLLIHPSDHVENVAKTLASFARNENADMIVLRTYGRKGLSRLLLGSLSETLMKKGGIPILVLPAVQQKPMRQTGTEKELQLLNPPLKLRRVA
jgi:nucleotide-binding universal stress UspA family protein